METGPFPGGEVRVIGRRCGRGTGSEEYRGEKARENYGETTKHVHFPTVSDY